MPVAGRPKNPRAQRSLRFAPRSQTITNERQADTGGQTPTRFHDDVHPAIVRRGTTPATMETENDVRLFAAGTIRRVWRQSIGFIPAPPAFAVSEQPATITRALRYKASSLYDAAGHDNTRFGAIRPYQEKENLQPDATLGAGRKVNRPTIRNRLTSFGSRVPVLVTRPAAEGS